jgi:hypothetical protein
MALLALASTDRASSRIARLASEDTPLGQSVLPRLSLTPANRHESISPERNTAIADMIVKFSCRRSNGARRRRARDVDVSRHNESVIV